MIALMENLTRVSDRRSLPVFWIQRQLLEVIHPTVNGVLAYTALAYWASGDQASCHVSLKMLADIVSTSEQTMRRGLAELVKLGVVRTKKRHQKTKKGKLQQLPHKYILIDLTEITQKTT
jgi:hypothetical protein